MIISRIFQISGENLIDSDATIIYQISIFSKDCTLNVCHFQVDTDHIC